MSKQQTAVEWLYEILTTENWEYKTYEEQNAIFIKAHAIEEQQIETAYNAGREYGCKHDDAETGEQYYNQTYGLPSEH